ncbi:MAG: alpha/beta hydrolase [Proteobacteria bacterium]|nr:alpha/beta hydrolase [Pseudomonadota bacterium]MCP4918734.1 alpha/beta hydrolase [Pseudomonadota bacterium]
MSLVEHYGLWRLSRAGFSRHDVDTSEGRVATWIRPGGGVPVVMLHGVSARGVHYRPLIERMLPELGTVVLPDFLGHGESEMPRSRAHISALCRGIGEVIEQTVDEPAVLFGNSMGGYAALKFAASRPERVRGLLVTSPAGGALTDAQRNEIMQHFLVDDWADGRALARRALPASGALLHWIIGFIKARQLRRPHIREMLSNVVQEDDLTPEELARLPAVSRIIWGTREELLHPLQRSWFLDSLPEHVVFEEPEGLGHSSYFEHTELVADRLRQVLSSV